MLTLPRPPPTPPLFPYTTLFRSFRLGPQPAYLVSHPELIREVLVTQHRSFHKGRALQRAKLFLGEGLLTSEEDFQDRKSTRLNSSHVSISYAVFCLKKKTAICPI